MYFTVLLMSDGRAFAVPATFGTEAEARKNWWQPRRVGTGSLGFAEEFRAKVEDVRVLPVTPAFREIADADPVALIPVHRAHFE